MPSRKKAQGRARKQAAEAQKNNLSSNGFSKRCNHFGERKWSRDDYAAASDLYSEYVDKYNERVRVGGENLIIDLHLLAYNTYDEYYQLSDARKELFRKLLLSLGSDLCVDAAKEKDLTNETTIAAVYLILIVTIEIRDKYNGASNQNIRGEIVATLNDIVYCPRQTIRFFHRRNLCDCLQDIYYKLKETTSKTSQCFYCKKVVEIKQMCRCDYCNVLQYCSYECALAHWPEHKVGCERLGHYKPTKPTKTFDDLEEVD